MKLYEKYLSEAKVNILGIFGNAEPSDANMDAVINLAKKYDKKLAKDIDKLYTDFFKKHEEYRIKLEYLIKKS